MATRITVIPESGEDWIQHTSDAIIACRGSGHGWPKLRPGKVNKYIRVRALRDGCYQLVLICRDCGMQRTLVTLPGGEIDFPAKYSYVQPDGYKSPKGSKVTSRDCLAEAWRRLRESEAYISERED